MSILGNQFVSTALLLPGDLDKKFTGIMTRMPRHLSRRLLAVTSGLNGSAQHAAMSGKVRLQDVCAMTVAAPTANTSCIANKNSQPTFEAAQHQLLLEWDYERNAADGIHPNTTTLGSKKLVHWVCHNGPKGQLHLYQMTASNRTRRNPSGCPYCSGWQACTCNSLQSHDPAISSEWDFGMNDITPADVTSRSGQVVWWKNEVRGSWQQCIAGCTEPRDKPR